MREININKALESPIEVGDVKIYNHSTDGITFELDNKHKLCENMSYIRGFATELPTLMKLINPQTILIAGLGLGLIPKYLEDTYPNPEVHVIEKNPDVIKATKQLGHLHQTDIRQGDMWMFDSPTKYDLIIADIWWDVEPDLLNPQLIVDVLKHKLTPTGVIYIPMISLLYKSNDKIMIV